jgi:hypothetical protein
MIKSVVNRSLTVLTRYLNDQEFWPEPDAQTAKPRKKAGKGTANAAGGSSGKAGRKNAVKGAGTAKEAQKSSAKTARKKRMGVSESSVDSAAGIRIMSPPESGVAV